MTTFWLIYPSDNSAYFKGSSLEDALVNYNLACKLRDAPETWEALSARGWKLCYVEDYS